MADHSKIEWTDATWQPITGCTIVSPGCTNCYAMKLAGGRLRHHPSRKGLTKPTKAGPVWTGQVRFNEQWIEQPRHWRDAKMIFVCAHGDLFHESVPHQWIDRVFAEMQACRWHTFQVLTKRPARMQDYLRRVWLARKDNSRPAIEGFAPNEKRYVLGPWKHIDEDNWRDWPLPNVLLGASVERQQEATLRRPALMEIAAAGWRTFVSYEPALGPVDWSGWEFLSWLISGGESGTRATPSHPDWHRTARDWCVENKVPYLFKQWGEWREVEEDDMRETPADRFVGSPPGFHVVRVGKKAAGRLLDGREWNEFPSD